MLMHVRILLFGLAFMAVAPCAQAAELIVLEQPGCVWCERFNAEIAPGYGKTEQGRRAPLRRVNIQRAWPADLKNVARARYTPTFILVHKGREIARMQGYPGDNFFWPLLDEMLSKLAARSGK